jgi:transcriptional regulator with XRE-family HTH domain
MIFPIQIRAARVIVGMSQDELAKRAAVSLGTIKRIEAARQEIAGTAQTVARIQQALERAGIMFIDQDGKRGPGVRLQRPIPCGVPAP